MIDKGEDFRLLDHAKTVIRDAVNDLESPEEDILPVLFANGPRGMVISGLEMPASEEGKDAVAKMMVGVIALARAKEVVFASTAWMSPPSESRPSDHPERVEKVVLVHWCGDGPSLHSGAVIRYSNRPPDLGQWEEVGGAWGGRFGDAIERGLKLAANAHKVPGLVELIEEGWESDPAGMLEKFLSVLGKVDVA